MNISANQMRKIHEIQLDMFSELKSIMDNMGIRYYFVHGSLLGAIRDSDFILQDDDIDIAIFRADYNQLLEKGNSLLKKGLFLQNSVNDNFPLGFAKLRNSNTTFIQPVLNGIKCNQGIYIDIFPIDYLPQNTVSRFIFNTKRMIINSRINLELMSCDKRKKNPLDIFSLWLFPDVKKAYIAREKLFSHTKPTNIIAIFSGKETERNMPIKWFEEIKQFNFSGLMVSCPIGYAEYLQRIYGKDFINHNPAYDRITTDGLVEISASILDIKKSYTEYL